MAAAAAVSGTRSLKRKKKCLLRNEIPTSVERCVAEETLLVSRSIALSSLFIFIFLNALTIDVFMTSVFSFLSSSSSSIAVLSVSLGQKQFNGPYTHTRIYKLLRLLSSRRVCVFTVGRIWFDWKWRREGRRRALVSTSGRRRNSLALIKRNIHFKDVAAPASLLPPFSWRKLGPGRQTL